MSKLLLYSAILLAFLAAGLGYLNHSWYRSVFFKQQTAIEQQQETIKKINGELSALKESMTSERTAEAQSQKNLDEAQQARIKAESALAEMQKQMAAKNEELEQKNKDLVAKDAVIQSMKESPKNITSTGASGSAANKKSAKAMALSKKDSEASSTNSVASSTNAEALPALPGTIVGKVAAINPSWNFVVLNVGENNGLTKDSEMKVMRNNQVIGKIKIASVEPLTAIGDIVPNTVAPGTTIQVEDQVVSTLIKAIKK